MVRIPGEGVYPPDLPPPLCEAMSFKSEQERVEIFLYINHGLKRMFYWKSRIDWSGYFYKNRLKDEFFTICLPHQLDLAKTLCRVFLFLIQLWMPQVESQLSIVYKFKDIDDYGLLYLFLYILILPKFSIYPYLEQSLLTQNNTQ